MTTGSAPRNFNDVLVDELSQRGMSNKDLAHVVSVSENTVSSWTTGTYKPRHSTMEQIASALNLTIDQLHGRPPPAPVTQSTAPATQPQSPGDAEAQRIVVALAALDLEATVAAVQRVTPPLMEILAAARRHAAGQT
jgi:DNA-binding XRE family transcriptional regulator